VCGELLISPESAIRHTQEVRLLFQDIDVQDIAPKRGAGKLFKYRLYANVIFEEAVLDPRLKNGDAIALESKLRLAGCTLPMRHSPLYRAPRFVIPIE
jgi:hypothetical protein